MHKFPRCIIVYRRMSQFSDPTAIPNQAIT